MAHTLFFGGKGGVGKSSCAAAHALNCAENGQRTLLVSTDPAHNLGDIFERRLDGQTTRAAANLDVIELDPERETTRYLDEVKANLRPWVNGERSQQVYRQLDLARHAPGTEEAALFDALTSLLLDHDADYDQLVFDTAPGGHTIRLLALPEIMGAWVDGLLERRRKVRSDYQSWLGDGEVVDDPIQQVLMRRRGRLAAVRERLTDAQRSAILLVANPEPLPVHETERTRHLLEDNGLPVLGVVINKCLPASVDSEWLHGWREQQRPWIERLTKHFSDRRCFILDHLARAPDSIAALTPLRNALAPLASSDG